MRLSVECRPSVPANEIDKTRFEQVCGQLIDNGLKFTPRGGEVRVQVSAQECNFCMRVDHSGPGVPGVERLSVFDKFSQAGDGRAKKRYSTGLGLTFCKLAVEAHGGSIDVSSRVGVGSQFWFQLPAVEPA